MIKIPPKTILNTFILALILISIATLAGCIGDANRGNNLQLQSSSYFTEEMYKSLNITIVKDGDTACSIEYTTIAGTAVAGMDYTATSGTLHFEPSERQKNITIQITADGWYSSPIYFTVKLTSPDGTVLRGKDTATVTINSSRTVGLYNWSSDIDDSAIFDLSGLGNNGRNSRTVLGSDNGSLYRYFDGNHHWIDIPSSDSLNITSGTFEAVIQSSKASNFNTFLCKRFYARQGGYWFGTNSGGFVYCYFQNDTGHITAFVTNNTNSPESFVCDGKKHFVAASYNTTQYILMVDGKVVYADYNKHDPIGPTSCTLQLSDVVNMANHGMTGRIYWESIANGAKTAAQMQEDYRKEAWRTGASVSTAAPVSNPASSEPVDITVNTASPGRPIPVDFLGLSYESPTVAQGYFKDNNTILLNLVKNLGGGVLRFGGNTGEGTYWSRTGETFRDVSPPAVAVVSPGDLDDLFAFAAASQWKVILGLNLGHYDPAMAADEAAYAAEASARNGDPLLAFAIGNEPSYYPFMNPNFHILERPADYSYADYHREYNAYKVAIRARVPDAPMSGPEGVGYWPSGNDYHLEWYQDFMRDEGDDIALATMHYYAVSPILSSSTASTQKSTIETSVAIADKYHVPVRFDETGTTAYDRSFSSALWSADYLFRLAEAGASGANFHGSLNNITTGSYSPIYVRNGQYQAGPIYYGMLLFHSAGQGRIIPVEANGSGELNTYATLGDDGKVRVVIINMGLDDRKARINIGMPNASATAMRLVGDSPNSENGIMFAGSQVSMDGAWSASVIEKVDRVDGRFEISIPAASAVVVTIE